MTTTTGYRLPKNAPTRIEWTPAKVARSWDHYAPGASVTITMTEPYVPDATGRILGSQSTHTIIGQVVPATRQGWMGEAFAYFCNQHPDHRVLIAALKHIAEDGAAGRGGVLSLPPASA